MPAARDEAGERAGFGEYPVGVDRLRIELLGEADDVLLGDGEVAVFVDRSSRVVLEVPVVDGHGEVGGAQGSRVRDELGHELRIALGQFSSTRTVCALVCRAVNSCVKSL